MWTLIRNGGVIPMSFILLFGVLALGSAFHFALRAERRTLGFVLGMSRAVVYTTLAATFADLGATCTTVARLGTQPDTDTRTLILIVIEGVGESTSPGIVGFSFVALTWMLVAVGQRRVDAKEGLLPGARAID
jgi:hypothetical protein